MKTLLLVPMLFLCILTGCTSIPSSEDLENDIASLNTEIEEAKEFASNFSGGLLSVLVKIRVEVLSNTKSMLEQKNTGIKRFIPVKYSVDGKGYSAPDDKKILLTNLDNDLKVLQNDLLEAKAKSARYSGGLLRVLSLTKVATVENSIAFLKQRQLLLKHDIPLYAILPNMTKVSKTEFKSTPGQDIDKF